MITELKPNQIFVFGSNIAGEHISGAAKQAYEQFGAIWGIGVGLAGQSYAIPTMGDWIDLKAYVEQFKDFARCNQDKEFLLTRIGCGIAGYADKQIKPLFDDAPKNVIKPKEWRIKHIPVYEELLTAPDEEINLKNVEFIDINGINTPFYIVNGITLNKRGEQRTKEIKQIVKEWKPVLEELSK
jgi:hypothetical protein